MSDVTFALPRKQQRSIAVPHRFSLNRMQTVEQGMVFVGLWLFFNIILNFGIVQQDLLGSEFGAQLLTKASIKY